MTKWTLWLLPVGLVVSMAIAQQDAKAFLKQVQQKYRNAKSLDVKMNMTIEFQAGGNTGRQVVDANVAIQFPNKVSAKMSGGMMGSSEIYSDGKTMYVYMPAMKQFMKREAPASLRGQDAGFLGPVGLLFVLLDEDLDKAGANRKYAFKGTQKIGAISTRIVEIADRENNATTTIRLMISEKDLLIHRVEVNQSLKNPQSGQNMTQKITATLKYNSFDKPIPASRFRFTPPKDAKEMQMPTPQGGPNPGAKP